MRALANSRARLASVGAAIFGALALLVGFRGPENTGVALVLAGIALMYLAWAIRQDQTVISLTNRVDRLQTAVTSNDPRHAVICRLRHCYSACISTHPVRAVLVGGSVLIVAGSGLAAHRGMRPSAHLVSLGGWSLGLGLFLSAFLPPDTPRAMSRWVRKIVLGHRFEAFIVFALWALAMALRSVSLDRIPALLTGDEGAMGLEAIKVLEGQQVNPFSTGWTSHPTLYFYNLALALRILGRNITALRMASALAGAFTVPITYLLARIILDRDKALMSALFLAGYHLHIHYSRLALNNIWAPLAAVLTFLCLWQGLKSRQSWLCALGGMAMGLGQYTYFGARLLPLVVVGWLLYLCFLNRHSATHDSVETRSELKDHLTLSENGWRLVVFWLAFALTLLPLSWFFVEHWHALTARFSQVGVFGSTGVDPAAEGYFAPLASGLFKSLMAFNYVRDRSIFYGPTLPLLHWLSGIGYVFGVFHALRHRHEPGYSILLIWLLGTIIFGGALLNHPPESPRLLFAAPAVAVLVTVGIAQLAEQIIRLASPLLRHSLPRITGRHRALAIILALCATSISVHFYLGVYTRSKQFGDANTRLAHELGVWARDLEPDHQVVFFGAPRMTYVGFPSIAFLAPDAHIEDVLEPIESPLPVKSDVTFVFVPQRMDELAIIAAAHPEGRRWEMLDDRGRLLFVAYGVQRGT